MVSIVDIELSEDSRLDRFRNLKSEGTRLNLRSAGVLSEHSARRGRVIAEGFLVIEQMLSSSVVPEAFLATPSGCARLLASGSEASRELPDSPLFCATAEVISDCVGFNFNRNILAVAPRPPELMVEEILKDPPPTIVILEGINDHENIGAIFRNAAALGIGAVLFGAGCADPYYRRAVRVSMGNVLRIPLAHFPGNRSTWQRGLNTIRSLGYRIVALTPADNAVHLPESFPLDQERVAFVVGAEGSGLSEHAMRTCDVRAQIPMSPGVDSLNVATSAAIAFYERARGGGFFRDKRQD